MNKDRNVLWKVVDNRAICDWICGPHKCIEVRGHSTPGYHVCACGHTFTYEHGVSITRIMYMVQEDIPLSKSQETKSA